MAKKQPRKQAGARGAFAGLRGQRLWILVGVVALMGSVLIYRQFFTGAVSSADQLTDTDVSSIQQDLNPQGPELQVSVEPNNPYVADAVGTINAAPVIRCATKTYFDKDVDHKTVRSMSPLNVPNNRTLACWTSSSGGS